MRDTIIIGTVCVAAILLGVWLYVSGDGTTPTPHASEGAVSYEVLAEGNNAGSVSERKNYRIKSASEYEQLLALMYGTDSPVLRPVNFEKEEVLAAFDGSHASGGYDIRVEGVTDDGLVRTISIVHTEPGETCMTTGALSSPFVMVVVPKTTLTLSKNVRTETTSCN